MNNYDEKYKNKNITGKQRFTLIITFLFGSVGIHRFYLKEYLYGFLYFIMFLISSKLRIITLIFSLIDIVRLGFLSEEEFYNKYPHLEDNYYR